MHALRKLNRLPAAFLVALALVFQLFAGPHALAGERPALDRFGNPLCIGMDDSGKELPLELPGSCILGCQAPSLLSPSSPPAVSAYAPGAWIDASAGPEAADASRAERRLAAHPRGPPTRS